MQAVKVILNTDSIILGPDQASESVNLRFGSNTSATFQLRPYKKSTDFNLAIGDINYGKFFGLSGLNNNETLSLTDIMINEFPGFVKLINKEQYGSNYKYKYFSSANNLKIKKWLIIALNQLNLSEGKDIEINVNSNLISINKYPSNLSSGSKGNPKKFN